MEKNNLGQDWDGKRFIGKNISYFSGNRRKPTEGKANSTPCQDLMEYFSNWTRKLVKVRLSEKTMRYTVGRIRFLQLGLRSG